MGTLTDDRVLSRRFGPRLGLVVSDVAALTLSILLALHLFNKQGTGTRDQAIWADGVLILPLLALVVLSFALNNLYAKAPDHMQNSSFTEFARRRLRPRVRRLRDTRHRLFLRRPPR